MSHLKELMTVQAIIEIVRAAEKNIFDQTSINVWLAVYPRSIDITNPQEIIEMVSAELEIYVEDIIGKSHNRLIVEARYIAIKMIKEMIPSLTLTRIAKVFDRDHTSIIHALKQVDDWMKTDKDFFKKYKSVHSRIFTYIEHVN